MNNTTPLHCRDLQTCIAFLRERLGTHWVVGAPLGLGKPNHLLNAIYDAARQHPDIRLELFTALSLNPPKPAKGLKQRFLAPFVERQFGDYPRLSYLADLDRGQVPANISISEFYFRSGSRMRDGHAQRHYLSSNYTHVARDMQARGINLLVQMVGVDEARPGHCSLSSNPDVTLDLLRAMGPEKLLVAVQINPDMPYMGGDAEIPLARCDLVLEGHPQRLFAVPRMPVNDQDYLIGLHASTLIRDGGTLQLGIGSLGDAICHTSVLRQQHNNQYQALLAAAQSRQRSEPELIRDWGGDQPFVHGLYAASEMFMDGFLRLYRAGILKRAVHDHREQRIGTLLHSAFFLGSQWMYDQLNAMDADERAQFQMTAVSRINQLYGNETLDRAQRVEARFMNTTMKMTLLGAAVSDQLEDGQVISGVGGQYNFVAMAHALERGRSVLMLRSYRGVGRAAVSNIVWAFPHVTIPRHLRDIVVTEYGIADLRSASDEEVIQRLLCICDSRWQAALRETAVAAGKLDPEWQIPPPFTRNNPQWVAQCLAPFRAAGVVNDYPFGSDFTETEQLLARALAVLARCAGTRTGRAQLLVRAMTDRPKAVARRKACLQRMDLAQPGGWRERLDRRVLLWALGQVAPPPG